MSKMEQVAAIRKRKFNVADDYLLHFNVSYIYIGSNVELLLFFKFVFETKMVEKRELVLLGLIVSRFAIVPSRLGFLTFNLAYIWFSPFQPFALPQRSLEPYFRPEGFCDA